MTKERKYDHDDNWTKIGYGGSVTDDVCERWVTLHWDDANKVRNLVLVSTIDGRCGLNVAFIGRIKSFV